MLEAATQDNVIDFPGRRRHGLVGGIIADRRLNVTARLALMLVRLSDNRWRCAFIRAEEMARWLGTNERQLYYSLERLIRWRLIRRVAVRQGGRTLVRYEPVVRVGDGFRDYVRRAQDDDRLDVCTRLHWVVAEMVEAGQPAQFTDAALGWGVSEDAMRQARGRMKEYGHFAVEPGRGRIPTLYKPGEKAVDANPEPTPEPTPEQTCTHREGNNPSGRKSAEADLRSGPSASSDDDPPRSRSRRADPSSGTDRTAASNWEIGDRGGGDRHAGFRPLLDEVHRVLRLTAADGTWAVLRMLWRDCGDAAMRSALREYRRGDTEDWSWLGDDPPPRERLRAFIARCKNLERIGFANAA